MKRRINYYSRYVILSHHLFFLFLAKMQRNFPWRLCDLARVLASLYIVYHSRVILCFISSNSIFLYFSQSRKVAKILLLSVLKMQRDFPWRLCNLTRVEIQNYKLFTTLVIPCFIKLSLKFISSPNFRFVSFKYVSNCFK